MTRPRLLAIVGLLSCAALVYWVYAKRVPFVEGYRVEAVVATSNQLKQGAPVRVAGVQVGEVVELRSGPGHRATIVMELDEDGRPVHRDATLRIRPRLFLEGGYYVDLKPGSPSGPELADGATLPQSQTAVPVSFGQVLSGLDADLRRAFTEGLGELSVGLDGGGAEGLGRAAEPLGSLSRDGAVVAEASRGQRRGDLPALVRDTGRVTAALASRTDDLQRLVTGLRDSTATLARRDRELRETFREVDATLGEAPEALDAVDRVLPPARRFAAALRPSLRRAPVVLDDLNAGLRQAMGLLGPRELPRLLTSLGPSIRRLPTLAPRLTELLGLVRPVTDCVERQVLPVLDAELDDGKLSTGTAVWQELVHGLTGFAGAASGFDGDGHYVRVTAAGGDQSIQLGTGSEAGRFAARVSGDIGSRPTPLPQGSSTPFRPDAVCREQQRVDVQSRTGRSVQRARHDPIGRKALPAVDGRADLLALLRKARRALRATGGGR